MSHAYEYARTFTAGRYDMDNPERVDGNGKQIRLAKEVEALLPNKKFVMRCNSTVMTITFEEDLLPSEKATLNGIISDHKNNV